MVIPSNTHSVFSVFFKNNMIPPALHSPPVVFSSSHTRTTTVSEQYEPPRARAKVHAYIHASVSCISQAPSYVVIVGGMKQVERNGKVT